MTRVFSVCFVSAMLMVLGCGDDEGVSGGADCRRALNACAEGYRCLQTGNGTFDCVPGRDAEMMPPDAFTVPDSDAGVADGGIPADGSVADAGNQDAESTSNADTSVGDASMNATDVALTEADVAAPSEVDATAPEVDAAQPVIPDAATPPDAAPPEVEVDAAVDPDVGIVEQPDMGEDEDFGPGRCNYERVWPREAEDLGGQQQPGTPVEPGVYEGLTVGGADWADWYRIEVCPGGRLSLDVRHPFDGVDIQLDVWHQREGRLREQNGANAENGQCTGREVFEWNNAGDAAAEIRFNVYPWAPPGRDGNNTYDLTVRVAGCN